MEDFFNGLLETILKAERRKAVCRRTGTGLPDQAGNRPRLARRPRAGLVSRRSGGPGNRPVGHYDPSARSSLDRPPEGWRAADDAFRSDPARRGPMTSIGRIPGSADPGSEIAASGAPRGDASASHRTRARRSRKATAGGWLKAPLGAPLPSILLESGGTEQDSGAFRAARTTELAENVQKPTTQTTRRKCQQGAHVRRSDRAPTRR